MDSAPHLAATEPNTPALSLQGVTFVRDSVEILRGITWSVGPGERWVVLGPNGSGKTSLARIASLYEHPSAGTVDVLGERLGRTDVRTLRKRVGFVSAALGNMVRPQLSCHDFVICGLNAALEPWWHTYTSDDSDKADEALDRLGVGYLSSRPFGNVSSGERQRAQIARALVTDPEILVLDEPASGLDMGGREDLVTDLDALVGLTHLLITHHLEEIPTTYGHALLLNDGTVSAAGPIDDVLTSENVSTCFDVEVDVDVRQRRWSATSKMR